MIKCQVVMNALDQIAPRQLAESWDTVGLMVGSPAQPVEKIFVCLDISEETLSMAQAAGCDMMVSHHPLFFKPIKNIRTDLPQGRLLQKIIQAQMSVFSAHTNLDIAAGGVNDVLAERIGLIHIEPFVVTGEEALLKLVAFVPKTAAEAVKEALGRAGAGKIGNYSNCMFSLDGEGQFLPMAGSQPFLGSEGKLETTAECRIETVFPAAQQKKIIRALLNVHPYEEPAYDLYPLKNTGTVFSLGRMGELSEPMPLKDFAKKVQQSLPTGVLRYVSAGERLVKKVALCSGSGAEFISKAAFMGADVYLTGDVRYHEAQKARECGMHLIDAGHFGTEMPVVEVLAQYLRQESQRGGWNVEIQTDTDSKDIFQSL